MLVTSGEVGKEMYICARGRLQVVDNEGKTVLATLKAGSYFGEISILNMGTAGNRRTASVRSVGYSDLFVLSKTDMWDVLKDYPAARVRLEAVAAKKIERYKKVPLEKGNDRRTLNNRMHLLAAFLLCSLKRNKKDTETCLYVCCQYKDKCTCFASATAQHRVIYFDYRGRRVPN